MIQAVAINTARQCFSKDFNRLHKQSNIKYKGTVSVTREPRARDSGAKGPTEYWWEAPNRGSTGEGHRAEHRECRSGVPGLGSISGNSESLGNTGIKEY